MTDDFSPDNFDDREPVPQAAIDAAVAAMSSLKPSINRTAGGREVAIHFRHAKRGYVGTIILDFAGARSAKVKFSPASFRNAVAAATAAME